MSDPAWEQRCAEHAAAVDVWRTELAQQRVTVVIVAEPADEAPDGALMHAVHSVEQQRFPRDRVDTHIVRNTEGYDLTTMRRWGVAAADTEWVVFLDVNEVWSPDTLERLFAMVGRASTGGGIVDNGVTVMLWKRESWLEHAS